MSDQPKPTGFDPDLMPFPDRFDKTTGEWTIGRLRQMYRDACGSMVPVAEAITVALADEREKVENLHKILGQKRTTIKELREQLVADRKENKMMRDQIGKHQQQLTAKREKVQTLVDALKLMPEIAYKSIIEGAGVTVENLPNELQCVCDAVFAKVKEKK